MSATTHFELLGLPVDWSVDPAQLEQSYRSLQRSVHPDRHSSGADRDRRLAVEHSSRVNDAYNTLKKPVSRARYLLELAGCPPSDSASFSDPAFLMEQVELRERLQSAAESTDQEAALAALRQELAVALDAGQQRFGAAWSDEDWEAAGEAFARMQFLSRFAEQLRDKEDELMDA